MLLQSHPFTIHHVSNNHSWICSQMLLTGFVQEITRISGLESSWKMVRGPRKAWISVKCNEVVLKNIEEQQEIVAVH